MANERITLDDFRADFAGKNGKPEGLSDGEWDDAVIIAWEECAWINTLTHDRAERALEAAVTSVQSR